jgi:MtrB/PioB family decaheme-associated outer membrane protein
MRTRTAILTGALLLASAGFARAQQTQQTQPTPAPAASTPKFGQVDFGFRADSTDGDVARYNRFRDLRQGGFLDSFRYKREEQTWAFRAEANNVGYRDQRYFADFQNIGKLKARFEWNQVPLFAAKQTKSLYKDAGNGVLAVDDSIQQAIQSATVLGTAARDAALNNAFASAPTRDLRSRRDIADFALVYSLNRDVDVKFNVKNFTRTGNNVQSFGFGTSPGLIPSVELGVPLDDRTTDLKGSIEYADQKAFLSLGYNGSWYNNHIPLLRFDNPLRSTDINGGTSVGQAALWPSNSAFAVNANGSYKLARSTRASAGLSVGRWSEDQTLPPMTVNTALVSPPLERASAEGRADIVSMVLNLNSRPADSLWLNARYRYYDYANKTPIFEAENAIIGDWSTGTQFHETEPASFKRKTLDLDASFTPVDYLSLGAGFGHEGGDRTFRIFERTAENTFRLSADSTANQYITLRTKYEYSKREGSGFEEELLDDVGEQPTTRHFDIANRKRTRVTGILAVTPVSWLSLNGSAWTGHDDYYATGFGLRDNNNRAYGIGFDAAPVDTVNLGVNYGREKYTANQYSRTAVPLGNSSGPNEFNDPRRDWWTDSADTVNTFTVDLDLLRAIEKTDIRISYDLSDGKATYVYDTRPNAPRVTVPLVESAIPIPVPLSPVKNRISTAKADVQYFVRPNVALGVAYWYEQYKVQDFALGEATIGSQVPVSAANGLFASTIYSGYMYRPYKAHTAWLKMTYLW